MSDDVSNRITQRLYLDEIIPGPSKRRIGARCPRPSRWAGRPYNTGWINGTATTFNSYAVQDANARLGVVQSRFWDDRVVTTFGYRVDKADITSYGLKIDR